MKPSSKKFFSPESFLVDGGWDGDGDGEGAWNSSGVKNRLCCLQMGSCILICFLEGRRVLVGVWVVLFCLGGVGVGVGALACGNWWFPNWAIERICDEDSL